MNKSENLLGALNSKECAVIACPDGGGQNLPREKCKRKRDNSSFRKDISPMTPSIDGRIALAMASEVKIPLNFVRTEERDGKELYENSSDLDGFESEN
jgi:hypothetical protein